MINLSINDFEDLPYFKANIKRKDGLLYKKIYEYQTDKDAINIVEYLTTIPRIPGLVLPIDTLAYNNMVYGYTMKEIVNSSNVSEYINHPFQININDVINNLFSALKEAHRYIIIGDIRNANILLTKTSAFLCDFDWSAKKGKPTLLMALHTIFVDNAYFKICDEETRCLLDSSLSDTFKLFLGILSIYYQMDMFSFCRIDKLYELLIELNANPLFIEFLKILIDDAKCGKIMPSIYLNEMGGSFDNPSEIDKNTIRIYVRSRRKN